MLIFTHNQFSPSLFSSIDYTASLKMHRELEWIDAQWHTNENIYPILVKIDCNGELCMVMSSNQVFVRNK